MRSPPNAPAGAGESSNDPPPNPICRRLLQKVRSMSTRLANQGRLIDRSKPIEFTFNGTRMTGYAGDTLASALLANGVHQIVYPRDRVSVWNGLLV